jgi:hypothetical protein
MGQPDPVQNDRPAIVDELIKALQDRKQLGIDRYKVALQPFNTRASLTDVMDELLDATIYFMQFVYEHEHQAQQTEYDTLLKKYSDAMQRALLAESQNADLKQKLYDTTSEALAWHARADAVQRSLKEISDELAEIKERGRDL